MVGYFLGPLLHLDSKAGQIDLRMESYTLLFTIADDLCVC